jgi:hypothetical protein
MHQRLLLLGLVLLLAGCEYVGATGSLTSFHGDSNGSQADSQIVDRLTREHRLFRFSLPRATIATMLPVLRSMMEEGPVPEITIIELGTGDAQERHGDTRMRRDVRRVLRLVREVPCVRWLSLKIAGVTGWYQGYVERADDFNRILARQVRDFDNAEVAPYREWAVDHPGAFLADGLHHTEGGKLHYADFVRHVANACP